MKHYMRHILPAAAFAAMALAPGAAQALTVTIDGVTSPTVLSDAVDTCMSAGAGPHVINITTDTLATPDRQVVITQPITINGDADNNTTACDILVDITGIRNAPDAGVQGWKSYIEIQAAGTVSVNNLKIHPAADGPFANLTNSPVQNVSGVRFFKPTNASDTGIYNFTKVAFSGSNSSNQFVDPASGADLYNMAGIKRWSGLNGSSEPNFTQVGVMLYSNDVAGGAGKIDSTLDHCKCALSRGTGLNIEGAGTSVTILGGVYGHVPRDGVRVANDASLTIKGTATDRVRVIRSTNTSGSNSHCIEATLNATMPLIEYVDVAGIQSANLLSLRDATINEISHVRCLGKYIQPEMVAPVNEAFFTNSASNRIDFVHDSTFHGVYGNPLNVNTALVNPILFKDCIFTGSSTTTTVAINSTASGVATFTNCAVPTDGTANESLSAAGFSGAGAVSPSLTVVNQVTASPIYQYTLSNYDWSDKQGAGTDVGAGNNNVLRPTNLAYLTASSTGGPLNGGAGPALAGISPNEWMLLED